MKVRWGSKEFLIFEYTLQIPAYFENDSSLNYN